MGPEQVRQKRPEQGGYVITCGHDKGEKESLAKVEKLHLAKKSLGLPKGGRWGQDKGAKET